jgi:hypothetical protein
MGHSRTSVVVALGLVTSVAGAQATPFVFTVLPNAATSTASAYGYYELGTANARSNRSRATGSSKPSGCARRSDRRS